MHKYRVQKVIGKGSYGEAVVVKNTRDGVRHVHAMQCVDSALLSLFGADHIAHVARRSCTC